MFIDIHAHLMQGSYKQHKEEILKTHEIYKVSRFYVSALGSFYPDEEEIYELNHAVYSFMNEHPECIKGFCYVNPVHDNALEVLKKGIEDYGMAGMKLWVATFCDDPRVFPLVEKCIGYKIPILIHAFHKAVGQLENETVGLNVANLARRYPEAKIIMAHLGSNCYNGIKAVRKYQNVCVDISGSMFRRDEIDYTKKQIGAHRILFGTDIPVAGSFPVKMGQVEEAELTALEREMIYYKNALKILDRSSNAFPLSSDCF